ncbi:MAG TPA: AMP-binding protein [Caldilineae bacterium]|nr:AMP-binding protein [Caldilineae bacterium]
MAASDRMLQFATINFDAALEEIFPTWLRGGALVLREQPGLIATDALTALVAEQGVTVLDLPTAYWHQWVQTLAQTRQSLPASLRLVVVGGEKALPERYEDWWGLVGDRVRWLNTYGPTEATIVTTSYDPLEDPTRTTGAEVPIGVALPNVTCYVLDAGLEPMPTGVPGELCIGGAAVARGYLHRPDLTATVFVPDPYSPEAGARMYRTGDLARMKANGDIEYLGRLDDQVKVRGFRVELGEIEAVLRAHEQVSEAVVVARRDGDAGSDALRLAAYFVSRSEQPPGSGELRRYLQARLPGYMVPAFFVALDHLPLTPSGKVNRRALPAPDQTSLELEAEFVAPTTDQEKTLADVWRQVLGVERVGVHDNFFELGGDSILSIQLVSRANQAGLQLTPQDVFQYPTVAQLAAVVREGVAIQAEQGVVEGAAPLTPIQQWFFEQDFAQPQHWNQSLLLQVRQQLDIKLLDEAIAALLEHHDALRMRFPASPTGREQVNAGVDDHTPLRIVDLSEVADADLAGAISSQCTQAQSACDLAAGPLFRTVYLQTGRGRTDRLFVVSHHLVMDGVSWRILMEDLQTAYAQLSQGRPVSLPAKTTAFKHWAERLPAYAASPDAERQAEFWLDAEQMAGRSDAAVSLPVDFPDGDNTEALAETLTVELDEDATRALLQDVPPVYRTEINDALLTALAQAIFRWSGQAAWVELEGHGREDLFEDVDISRTVGWFTTTYPVWLDITRTYDPGSALTQVKEQLRAIPGHGIAYGLVRYLGRESLARRLRSLPEPQLSFNYLGQSEQGQAPSALLGPAPEFKGPDRSPEAHRSHLIEINGGVSEGRLTMSWRYSRAQYRSDTIQWLARHFLDALQEIIRHCQSPDAGGVTPSDFGLADLDQHELDNLLGKF